ncbi:EamA family transporter [Actinoplanes sp. NPDC049548]|uniref:DMT family transporter n=1 Tax=Actinoplanes sp. NPDC049548 TaxID=3155152 RepID=UPI00341DF842
MIGVLLALAASGLWGSADFLAGQASRRVPVLTVTLVSQAAGLAAMAVVLAVRGGVSTGAAWWGVAAGVVGVAAVTCFYQALAVGTMSVVAPVVATSAAVPVLVGLVRGDRPSPLAAIGMGVALAGVLAASRSPGTARPADHGRSLVLAVAAALLLGLQLVFLDGAGHTDALSGVAASRLASVVLVGMVALLRRPAIEPRWLPQVAVVGLLDTGANLAYALASDRGLLSLIAVLASLYPVLTVALAYTRLGERLSRTQATGVGLTLIGVICIVG